MFLNNKIVKIIGSPLVFVCRVCGLLPFVKKMAYTLGLYKYEHDSSFDVAQYWESRYAYQEEGNSGCGSYGRLADFKAHVITNFIDTHKISSIIEFGCGDGNQLSLLVTKTPYQYLGFDVSKTIIEKISAKFKDDNSKQFKHITEYKGETAELVLSLDVIYHLVQDDVYIDYMQRLFGASEAGGGGVCM